MKASIILVIADRDYRSVARSQALHIKCRRRARRPVDAIGRSHDSGRVAAGDKTLDERWGDGEGGGALAGVEDAETAAGAGSDVEEAASVVEAVGDFVDGFGDVGEDGGYGLRYFGVFVVHEAEHVEGGELVDVLGEWVAGFSEEGG